MLLMKDIIREGDERLHKRSVDVEIPFTEEDQKTLEAMIEYVENSIDEELSQLYELRPAVGIAAPQIGVLKKMIVIKAHDEEDILHFYALVNPKIKSYSQEKVYLPGGEGCLSVDRPVDGYIHRPRRVTIDTYLYEEKEGNKQLVHQRLRLKDYLAIVFQHEYDHLNGILFTKHINEENPFYIPEDSSPIKFKDIIEEDDDEEQE